MTNSRKTQGNWANEEGATQICAATDLRRHHAREVIERITSRSQWLGESDRQLLLAIYGDGKSAKDLAALLNVSPRAIRSRVRRLVQRVSSDLYKFVAVHYESWPPNMRRVAEACVFRGLSIKDAANELGISYYTVRRQIDLVRAMARADLQHHQPRMHNPSTLTQRRGVPEHRQLDEGRHSAFAVGRGSLSKAV